MPTFVQQAGWAALVVVAVIAAIRLDERRIATIDWTLDRIGAILVLVTLVLIIPFQVSAVMNRAPISQAQPAGTTTTAAKRDVYWFIFDRYGSERALQLQYGIDNDLPEWLEAAWLHGAQGQSRELHPDGALDGDDGPDAASRHDREGPGCPQRGHHDRQRVAPGSADRAPVQGPRIPLRPHRQRVRSDPHRPRRRRQLHRALAAGHGRLRGRALRHECCAGPPQTPAPARTGPGAPVRLQHVRARRRRQAARRARAEVRHDPRPPPAPSRGLRSRWLVHRGRRRQPSSAAHEMYRRQLAYTNTRIEAILTDLQSLPDGPATDHHPPGRRGAVAPLLWHGAQDGRRLARRRLREGARAEVRDPQCLVRAGRRGPRSRTRR